MTDARIPLLVAVAGHRDPRPEDVPALKAATEKLFGELRKKVPNTPIAVLSGLAEGADQIGADLALAMGFELVAVLPMPRADYEQDFAGPALEVFRELLARASRVVELPYEPGNTRESIAAYGPARDRQYDALARYLADMGHVLVAFWDGTRTGLPGGTGSLVDYRLSGIAPPHATRPVGPNPSRTGQTYRIATPRRSAKEPPNELAGATELVKAEAPSAGEEASLGRNLLTHVDSYNADLKGLSPEGQRWPLLPARALEKLGDRDQQRLAAYYEGADALALRHRDDANRWLLALAGGVLLAFGLFETFSHFWVSIWPLLFYLLALGVTWAFYTLFVRRGHRHERYLDYRALAEAMRVQFFWRLAGLRDSVADHYLARQIDELAWIRQAARGASALPQSPIPFADGLPLIIEHWIKHQRDYFVKAVAREGETLKRWRRRLGWAYFAGIGVALALLLWGLFLHNQDFHHGVNPWVLHSIIVFMALMPALAASIGYVVERRGYAEHERRYAHMAHLFDWAHGELTGKVVPDKAQTLEILREVGREALAENGDWLILHRERPLRPPTGG